MKDLHLWQVMLLATAASFVVVLVRDIIIRKLKRGKRPAQDRTQQRNDLPPKTQAIIRSSEGRSKCHLNRWKL